MTGILPQNRAFISNPSPSGRLSKKLPKGFLISKDSVPYRDAYGDYGVSLGSNLPPPFTPQPSRPPKKTSTSKRGAEKAPSTTKRSWGNFTLKNPKAPPFTCSAQLNKISIPLGQKAQIMVGLASSPISKFSPSPVDTCRCSNSAKSNPSLIISTRYSAKYQKPHQSHQSDHHPKSENKKPAWFAQLTQNSLETPCYSSSDPLTI